MKKLTLSVDPDVLADALLERYGISR